MEILDKEQQKKALNYIIVLLRKEIDHTKQTIFFTKETTIKNKLSDRLKMMEEDYKMFMQLDQKLKSK